MKTEINSSDLIPIDKHFKVSAGPGAGKTYWLVQHIKNILQNSKRLVPTTQIACITYTNTGVEEIKKRLSNSLNRIEVSTIHNFLYKYLIKPYLFLVNDDGNGMPLVNLKKLDGHNEHIISIGFLNQWLKESKGTRYAYKNINILIDGIKSAKWKLDEKGNIFYQVTEERFIGAFKKFVPKGSLIDYKKKYWQYGIIHHDDVLYFSYKIMTEHPNIIPIIQGKFPYIFIDEFQDTNPLQTAIVKMLASEQTTIGVIGDSAQSIFSFQGATVQDFVLFSLPNLKEYTIADNRRSSEEIIKVLNHTRKKEGLVQVSKRGKIGVFPEIVIGSIDQVAKFSNKNNLTSLCFTNNDAGKLRLNAQSNCGQIWKEIISNLDKRGRILYNLVYGIEYIRQNKLKEGLRSVQKIIKSAKGIKLHKFQKQKITIELIDLILENYDSIQTRTITEVCNDIILTFLKNKKLEPFSKITRGAIKQFSDGYIYENMVQGVNLKDDSSNVKTIHKAKGAEFDNVLVYLESEKILFDYIINADVTAADDRARLYYVGMSRAKKSLYLAVPTISAANEQLIKAIGFHNIIRC